MTDSVKQATGLSLQELSRAAEERTLWTSFIHTVGRSQSDLTECKNSNEACMWNVHGTCVGCACGMGTGPAIGICLQGMNVAEYEKARGHACGVHLRCM